MTDPNVSHNCGESPLAGAVLSHVDAQETLASLVQKLSSTTVCYWWKLLGEDHNSLCHLLDVSAQEMRLILRKCQILYGDNDSFRTSEFEKLMLRIGVDYSIYRPKGKPEYFLKIGAKTDDSHAVLVPKDMYSIGGILEQMPVVGVHLPGIRTKVSRRLALDLVAVSIDTPTNVDETPMTTVGQSDPSIQSQSHIELNSRKRSDSAPKKRSTLDE